ncbi:MAG: hypothetical protein R3C03_07845 [Pirellulaceae bacterium]
MFQRLVQRRTTSLGNEFTGEHRGNGAPSCSNATTLAKRIARPWTEVFYEHLVTQPENQIRRMVAETGLAWSATCLEPQDASSHVLTASAAQVRRPLYESSFGRWNRFSTDLQPLFEMLEPEIKQYELDLAAAD